MIPVIGEISRFQSQPTAKALDIELNRWTSPVDSEATEKHIVPSDTISDHPFKKLTLIFFTYWIFVVVPKSLKGREFAKSDCNPVGQEQSKSCSHTPVDRKFIPSYTRFVHPYIKKWKGERWKGGIVSINLRRCYCWCVSHFLEHVLVLYGSRIKSGFRMNDYMLRSLLLLLGLQTSAT